MCLIIIYVWKSGRRKNDHLYNMLYLPETGSSSNDEDLWPTEPGSCLGYFLSEENGEIFYHHYYIQHDPFGCRKMTYNIFKDSFLKKLISLDDDSRESGVLWPTEPGSCLGYYFSLQDGQVFMHYYEPMGDPFECGECENMGQ